jgi:hypothetical protein
LSYSGGGYRINHSCSDDSQMVTACLWGSVTRTSFMMCLGTRWVIK